MDFSSDINHIRSFAMGILEAGSIQRKVALDLGFDISTMGFDISIIPKRKNYNMERVLDGQKSSQELPNYYHQIPAKTTPICTSII